MLLNFQTLKLAPLLAQYLYSTKRLDLPGIGSFLLDPSVIVETENAQQHKAAITNGITFENNTSIKESSELINYISAQTGKMKALAAADLSSHVELIQQFLNIGKPFLLEGIGSLVKIKSGSFEFTSGSLTSEKLKDLTVKEATVTSAKEESFSSYDPLVGSERPVLVRYKKPIMALLILFGAGLAIWGGYTVYKNTGSKQVASVADSNQQATVIRQEPISQETTTTLPSTTPNSPVDTSQRVQAQPVSTPVHSDRMKFVLETAGMARANDRFKRLKTFLWDVQMETKDSLQYKLFLLIPAVATDTTRILDSLTALNGRRVYIEYN